MARCTNVSTDYMTPLFEWPNNDRWIIDRMLFLMSLQDHAFEVYYSPGGTTVEEIMENYRNSFSRELSDLHYRYPSHFAVANKQRVETWFPKLEDINGDASIC